MAQPLHRLYKTKLTLLATLITVSGAGLLLLAHRLQDLPSWSPLAGLPITDIGSALFTTGLIVVAFEYIDRQDAEERALQRLRTVVAEQAPVLRDAVIEGFAVDPDTLAKVASPATLDQVVRNSLTVQLGDRELAHEVYDDLRAQVIRAQERWRDVDVSVALSPWAGGPDSGDGSMFTATVRWEYRTTLANPMQRFSCVDDLDEYRQLLQDPTSTLVWYFNPTGKLTAASPEAFELTQFTIDGQPRPTRRGRRTRSQTFMVSADDKAGTAPREVLVSYTYRVLVQRHSHTLTLDIAKPARGLKIQLWYDGCGIRYVNALDFIASAQLPRISRSTADAPRPTIEVGFDGWVLPKSGVAFVWVLDEELGESRPNAK